jgi:D-tagatose-1,6-bisphosphate aldolase subunit GatZ/KbaZ
MMKHPIQKILEKRKTGERVGIYSACSAHPYVLQAVIKRAKETNSVAVIESTANQVNQFGGYTGMLPADFADMVKTIVKKNDFPIENLILGGDHLGPLIWTNEEAESAMKKSEELVRQYVMAGYTKIHIDTSMKLA